MEKTQIIEMFHHIHHEDKEHIVHHCGGMHAEGNPKLDFQIKHCSCGKHCIDKREAIGHDFGHNEMLVEFIEKCPEGGWHIESGVIIGGKNDIPQRRAL